MLLFLFQSQKVICKVVEKEYITKYDNIFLFHEIFQLGRPQNLEIKTKLLSWPVQKFKFYLSTKLENFMNIKNNTVPTPIEDAASYFRNFLGVVQASDALIVGRGYHVFIVVLLIIVVHSARVRAFHLLGQLFVAPDSFDTCACRRCNA